MRPMRMAESIAIISAIHPISVVGKMPSPALMTVAVLLLVKPSLVTTDVVSICFSVVFVAPVCFPTTGVVSFVVFVETFTSDEFD